MAERGEGGMNGIYAVWRKDGRVAEPLSLIAHAAGANSAEGAIRLLDAGQAGIVVCGDSGLYDSHEDTRVLVACEADIYNRPELVESVGQACGTAALFAALYERHGTDFVAKLRGRFAVIIWDRVAREITAAVDHFGVGRLVYASAHRTFWIGSRIDALAKSGEVDMTVNPRAIVNLLNFSINLGPATILANVERLQPGHLVTAREGNVRVRRYWDMRYAPEDVDERVLARELEAVVEGTVRATACGRDPDRTGAFLSGGTDSSTVVGLLERINAKGTKAFSIGFAEERFNELDYAKLAARRFHARHFVHVLGPDECFDALGRILGGFDEPFGNASAVPTYFCAQIAKQNGVDMMLTGDGGDELFGGNERYATDAVFQTYHRVPAPLRTGVIEPFLNVLPFDGGPFGRVKRYIRRANLPPMERFLSFQFLAVCPPETVFDGDFLRALDGYTILDVPGTYYAEAPARDHLDRLLYVDVKITLGDSDLPKVTRMCDLAGITPRYPLLDRTVAEFSCRVPAALKIKGLKKRYLFKKAFGQLLPQEILRKTKHGFGIPVANWFKSHAGFRELMHDTLLSARALQRGYFGRGLTEELLRRQQADDSPFYGDTLWTLLVLELWHREVTDARLAVTR
jgi:asparagine synthase (glutamine-hydrolysing)